MPVTQAMLMAAGLGTRLRPFTDRAPKVLMPVLGVPAAQFAIDSLLAAGVRKIVANVHHHAEAAREGLEKLDPAAASRAELVISDESRLLLGSAGGVKKALAHLGDKPFFLVNADVLCDVDLSALASAHEALRRKHGVVLTLAVAPRGPVGAKYAEILTEGDEHSAGLVRGIGPHATGRPFFVGAAVLEREALDRVPDGIPSETVPLIFQPAIAARRAGFVFAQGGYGIWKDIGSPALWLDAHLDLIDRLETGALPAAWRRRIEEKASRRAHGVWFGKEYRGRGLSRLGPRCFWDGRGQVPCELGPEAVLYGSASGPGLDAPLRGGIGRDGLWVQVAGL